jgi:hypothetical protein
MSLHPHYVLMRQLESQLRKVQEEADPICQELLAAGGNNISINDEELVRLRFTAKMAELQAVKDAIQAEKENWTE